MSILAAGMLVRANKHAEILYESTHKVQLKLSDHVVCERMRGGIK